MNSTATAAFKEPPEPQRQYYKCSNCNQQIVTGNGELAIAITRKMMIDGTTHPKGTVFRFCDKDCYEEWRDGREVMSKWFKKINWKTANTVEWLNKMGEQAENMTGNPGQDPGDKHKQDE